MLIPALRRGTPAHYVPTQPPAPGKAPAPTQEEIGPTMRPKRPTILVVDDEPLQIALVTAALERNGRYRTLTATSPLKGLELARAEAPDLAICDVTMPEMDGIELTRILQFEFPSMPVIILTGKEDIRTSDAAYQAGAVDFAVKPLDPLHLLSRIEHALRDAPVREMGQAATRSQFAETVLGRHPRIQELRVFIQNVASVPGVPALLLGESGTGKNLVARAIHAAASHVENARFVEVNCAALPANLLEAELFGYEKGAFTDARQAKQGLVETAAGGTLFLDEIGTLSLELQAKLLTFLESRRFRRLGGTTDRGVELRVLAATNADLQDEVRAGRFREDLFYRLNVAYFVLPPLREIPSDIPDLARHFVEKAAAYFRKPPPEINAESLRRLQEYEWPGNVRELRNVVERALIFFRGGRLALEPPRAGEGVVVPESREEPQTMEGGMGTPRDSVALPLGLTLDDVERRYIQATLEATGGHVGRAAEILGVTRKVLWARRRKLGLLD